jgi:hypothetical protein
MKASLPNIAARKRRQTPTRRINLQCPRRVRLRSPVTVRLNHRSLIAGLPALAAVVGMTVLVGGCSSQPKEVPVMELHSRQLWTAEDMVDAAISDADRSRIDAHASKYGLPGMRYSTGPVWSRVFIGEVGKSPLCTIHSAQVDSHFIALGLAARITHTVHGSLNWKGRDYPIHAEGTRTTEGLTGSPESDAIQRGIIDAAHKVKFIVTGGLEH